MHDDIKKFSIEGEMADANIPQNKERLVNYVESLMRDYSFVPALDLEPQFTVNYNPDAEVFNFELSVYGVKVDKENVWDTSGVMSGKKIPRYIPQAK